MSANAFIDAVGQLINDLRLLDSVSLDDKHLDEIVDRAQDEVKSLGYPRPFCDAALKKLILEIVNR